MALGDLWNEFQQDVIPSKGGAGVIQGPAKFVKRQVKKGIALANTPETNSSGTFDRRSGWSYNPVQNKQGGSGGDGASTGDASGYGANVQSEAVGRIASNYITPEINSEIVDKPQGLGNITPKLETKVPYGAPPSPVESVTPLLDENKTPTPTPTQQPTPSYKFSTSGPNGNTLNIADENNKSLGYISRTNGQPAIVPEVRDTSGNRVMNDSMSDALSSNPTIKLGFTNEGLSKIRPETEEQRANRERDASVVQARRDAFDKWRAGDIAKTNLQNAAEQAAYMNRPDVIANIGESQQAAIAQANDSAAKLGLEQQKLAQDETQSQRADTTARYLGEMQSEASVASNIGAKKYKEQQAELVRKYRDVNNIQKEYNKYLSDASKGAYLDPKVVAVQMSNWLKRYQAAGIPENEARQRLGLPPLAQ